jgi:hypothetical protein
LDLYRVFVELASHPHVLEVSVVARSHAKWGERPMAFVILHKHHAGTWTEKHDEFAQELKQHARTRLPGFACPEWVLVVEELPVSPHRDQSYFVPELSSRKHQQAKSSRLTCAKLLQSSRRRRLFSFIMIDVMNGIYNADGE